MGAKHNRDALEDVYRGFDIRGHDAKGSDKFVVDFDLERRFLREAVDIDGESLQSSDNVFDHLNIMLDTSQFVTEVFYGGRLTRDVDGDREAFRDLTEPAHDRDSGVGGRGGQVACGRELRGSHRFVERVQAVGGPLVGCGGRIRGGRGVLRDGRRGLGGFRRYFSGSVRVVLERLGGSLGDLDGPGGGLTRYALGLAGGSDGKGGIPSGSGTGREWNRFGGTLGGCRPVTRQGRRVTGSVGVGGIDRLIETIRGVGSGHGSFGGRCRCHLGVGGDGGMFPGVHRGAFADGQAGGGSRGDGGG